VRRAQSGCGVWNEDGWFLAGLRGGWPNRDVDSSEITGYSSKASRTAIDRSGIRALYECPTILELVSSAGSQAEAVLLRGTWGWL
jgi:hypothetical protein